MLSSEITEERIRFSVHGDMCEGTLAYPNHAAPSSAVLLLAPHPLMGGNMDNNVIRHLARRAAEEGALTLRFNYRGVEGSDLTLPAGTSRYEYFSRMEERREYDLLLPESREAADFLRAAGASLPMVVLGYSLGALLGARLPDNMGHVRLVCISPPNARVPLEVFHQVRLPKVVVGGDHDTFFDSETFKQDFALWSEPKTFVRFSNADHFFRGDEERLFATIHRFLRSSTMNV